MIAAEALAHLRSNLTQTAIAQTPQLDHAHRLQAVVELDLPIDSS
jgi:hypothetical protein